MTSDPNDVLLQRASLLLGQRRFEAAQQELRRLLADDPENVRAHALLSLALSQDDRIGDRARTEEHRQQLVTATSHAQLAIAADPSDPVGFFALAVVQLQRGDHAAALAAGRTAIALDPYDADAHSIVAVTLLRSRKYAEALAAAEAGLQVDPEHGGCTNNRSLALDRLGRGGDAIEAARAQLSRDPDDSAAHAAVGFAHLNRGEYKQAQVSFREALRLDPTDEFARSGMIEAINSGNFLYRTLYRYFVWLGRMNRQMAFALMIGLWLLANNINRVAEQIPVLKPFTTVIVMLYVMFALSTWIATPLMRTLLRFHPFGRHLLNGIERWTSNLIAIFLTLGIITFIAGLTFFHFEAGMIGAVYWMVVAVLTAASMNQNTAKARWGVGAASLVVALLPWIGLLTTIASGGGLSTMSGFIQWFVYGSLAIQIGSQVLAARTPRF